MDSFACQLATERRWLSRTARAQLRNAAWAEDAVSETMLAALEKRPDFDDPQRLRAWLFGVLRHKVVDQLRRQQDGLVDGPDTPHEVLEGLRGDPGDEPPQRVARGQFLVALARMLEHLPPAQSRAFVMREAWGCETAEICAELGISPNHLWVMLFRARASLRRKMAPWR